MTTKNRQCARKNPNSGVRVRGTGKETRNAEPFLLGALAVYEQAERPFSKRLEIDSQCQVRAVGGTYPERC
jgi:hypothetical protein